MNTSHALMYIVRCGRRIGIGVASERSLLTRFPDHLGIHTMQAQIQFAKLFILTAFK